MQYNVLIWETCSISPQRLVPSGVLEHLAPDKGLPVFT